MTTHDSDPRQREIRSSRVEGVTLVIHYWPSQQERVKRTLGRQLANCMESL